METTNRILVTQFIEEIWNKDQPESMRMYLHPLFSDHSLPPHLSPDAEGLKQWIAATGRSFGHRTVIEEMVCEKEKVMIKIRMHLKHIGTWRNIEPLGTEVLAVGYRYFKISEGKIAEHWALIDGNAIENQLRESSHGCKIQE